MSLRVVLLVVHILSGSAGLVLGPVAMLAAKRRGLHTRAGWFFFLAMTGVCITGAALAIVSWGRLWWFLPISVFSYFWATLGYLSARVRFEGWLRWHIAGQGGAYIALTTALLVVNVGAGVVGAWLLPTLIGSPLIARAINARTGRPSARPAGGPTA